MITLIVFACKKVRETKNELDAISIIYLALSIFCIYASCRLPEFGLPSASFYRYFYGCTAVYTLPAMFNSPKFENIKSVKMLGLDIGLSLCFAACYFANLFMC